ncbi:MULTISPECIES: branched-chain amino acid ABC transporter permease [unclassified Chelatococcus]|uniref:branched-chain amino acid ABC transporter permease n=1 Tax=unclassified Chelatococcus TaxID=2638111 RepID=UPI001BCBF6D5|nr:MULTISPECIES: branched-chain amino acid ABC transporter permease [unclassified Chelatococcus]MBS7697417.1 branched-chain amino acid ABC transporter permease [Chelatococcus sp. YT9]MBX3559272.1 branched-chain amino acid ABC transporter permease [Chelatococcus sp.]
MTRRGYLPIILIVAILALLPFAVTSNVVLNFVVFVLIITLAAQGWNLLGGVGGQSSFGHAAFFGTGAYVSAILQVRFGINAWVATAVAVACGAAVGWIIGFLSFRAGLRGSYFALVTLAFAEVLRILANAAGFTGGAAGMLMKLDVGFWNMQFTSRAAFLWLALGFVAVGLIVCQMITNSRFGAQLVAVRENEEAARALGVDVLSVKLKAITVSAALTAVAGCLYLQYFLYIDANIAYGLWISVEALLAPMVGGRGLVLGPIIGAFTLHGLGEASKLLAGRVAGIDLAVYGAVLILVVAFAPGGVLGLLRKLRFRPQPVTKTAEETA